MLNLTRLLKKFVLPGNRYLEIGCAPGKLLAWVRSELHATVAGLDYSEAGIAQCRTLFTALQLEAELYCADLFNHEIPAESFDIVASFGVVEHFNDPRPAVRKHIELVRPGGVALIAIPNYGGLYGILQKWCDKENLALHNLDIMTRKR